jgi:hypothetical protein|nr:hypothetical protein [uncultured Prevotella sp.]
MTIETLTNIISSAVALGMAQYRTMVEPLSDKISQRKALHYIRRMGYSQKLLSAWTDRGLVHRHKDGERNSPVYYSMKELSRAILMEKVEENEISECL